MLHSGLRLLVLLLTAVAVGCAHTESEWHQVTSASGDYFVEFPGETSTHTETDPSTGAPVQMTVSEFGGVTFSLSERPLSGLTPPPLDEAVDRSVEQMRAGTSPSSAAPLTMTEISRTTGDFEGVETRRFVYDLIHGNTKARISALLFYRNDVIVQAIVVSNDEADSESVDRFLSSLRARSH